MILMRCEGLADGSESMHVGKFLRYYDADKFGYGGMIEWTTNPEDAMKFASLEELLSEWRRQSKTMPLRPDGEPNRPLTAYSVSTVVQP
jgi:hypothetical protein